MIPPEAFHITPKMMVDHIDSFGKGLNDWEKRFIADLKDRPPVRYSLKQQEIIGRIYDQKV